MIIKNSIEFRLKDLPLEFWEEHKGIPDYVLAEKIGVSLLILRRVRKELNMKDRIAILENRFDKNRKKGSFLQLKLMFEDPLVSLTEVGEYFDFTKAQASIYFQSIYQRKYRGCFSGRKPRNRKVPFYKGQMYQVYLDALSILKKKKFKKAKIVRKDYTFRIHVNGYVLSAHRFYKSDIKKYPYMHTVQTSKSRDDVDFFFCFTEKRIYLIPKGYMTARSISVPIKHKNVGKYKEFLDNWEILK